jgi:hypothetical protein
MIRERLSYHARAVRISTALYTVLNLVLSICQRVHIVIRISFLPKKSWTEKHQFFFRLFCAHKLVLAS